ncbi:MAG: hypothetical protein K8R37_03665 [Bacteroidales bacterium]|nr:hypothetical protein [Bacteroidales bacterium]
MKVIVDANIAFSAILNTNGKIGDLLLNSEDIIEFVSLRYMLFEVSKYHYKIQKITGLTKNEIEKIQLRIMKKITFISEEQISKESWTKANDIVKDIDQKDAPYVAFSDFLGIKIWTGDKPLRKGLLKKGYDLTIKTDELYKLRNELKK